MKKTKNINELGLQENHFLCNSIRRLMNEEKRTFYDACKTFKCERLYKLKNVTKREALFYSINLDIFYKIINNHY